MINKRSLKYKIKGLAKKAGQSYKIKKTNNREYRFARKHTSEHLNPELRNKAIAFFKPYYKIDPIFHEFYTEKTGIFDEKYIPNDCYYNYINSYFNDVSAAKIIDNKCFYTRMFGDYCKLPPTIAYRMNHFWYDENMHNISEESLLATVKNSEEIVVKRATESAGGHGVEFLTGNNIDTQFLDICNEIKGDIVVQYPFKQHEALSKLHAESVNTIRVMSLLCKSGEVKIISVVVRIGIGSSRVDNACSGGIICGIEEDGRLKDRAFKPEGEVFFSHPTSGERFSDHRIPSYEAVIELVRKLHPLVPHFRLVSWDFSVNEMGEPVLIETNLNYGEMEFHQLCNGPLFGNDTKQILDEVFHKNKNSRL